MYSALYSDLCLDDDHGQVELHGRRIQHLRQIMEGLYNDLSPTKFVAIPLSSFYTLQYRVFISVAERDPVLGIHDHWRPDHIARHGLYQHGRTFSQGPGHTPAIINKGKRWCSLSSFCNNHHGINTDADLTDSWGCPCFSGRGNTQCECSDDEQYRPLR